MGLTGVHGIVGSGYDNNTLYGYTTPFFSSQTIASVYAINNSTGAAPFEATLDSSLGPVWGATDPAADLAVEPTSTAFILGSLLALAAVRAHRRG